MQRRQMSFKCTTQRRRFGRPRPPRSPTQVGRWLKVQTSACGVCVRVRLRACVRACVRAWLLVLFSSAEFHCASSLCVQEERALRLPSQAALARDLDAVDAELQEDPEPDTHLYCGYRCVRACLRACTRPCAHPCFRALPCFCASTLQCFTDSMLASLCGFVCVFVRWFRLWGPPCALLLTGRAMCRGPRHAELHAFTPQ